MSHDDMITIHADILQITDAAVLIACEGDEHWLPLSQIDFCGERGDTDVPISLPEWLADDKGLSDDDGMVRATITDIRTGLPKHEDDGKNCRNCALLVLADNENAPMPPECMECTRSGLVGGTKDNWTDNGEEPDTPSRPTEPAYLKTETITVSVPLDIEERESVGDRMASALEKISELEDDLDSYRKSINAEIKTLQKDAEKARKEWQEGKIEQEVYCDVMADYGQEAIIWVDHDNGNEVKRRAMTAEGRQYRLPIPRPGDAASAATTPAESADERPAPMSMGTPKTCITCGSLAGRDGDDLPETCQTCAQANNGEDDNWHPIRECRTCIHSHTHVNMPPCAGCALNVEESQRGETDAWEWQDEESTDDAPESAPENSSEGGAEVAPDAAGEEPEIEEDNSTLAEEN